MSIPGSAAPFLLAQQPAEGAYEIERSLRFNSSDSAYLSRTPASAGNRRTYTYSAWVKRAAIGSGTYYFFTAVDGSNADIIGFEADRFYWYNSFSGSVNSQALYRDPSAWYHVLASVDSTQAVATDRVKLYVNGAEVAYSAVLYPSLNRDFAVNNTVAHKVGQYFTTNSSNFYLADIHFIDGQALDPTSFTEVDATTGQLVPIAYSGTYGTNGFHLPFSDNSTTAALGTDTSGNSNTWTVNNISVAAGSGNDSLVDTPTSYGTDTGAGGEVRGNYATLNPLTNAGLTLSNGNLDFTSTLSNRDTCIATHGVSSGKWYWEYTVSGTDYSTAIGIEPAGYYPAPDARTGDASAGYAWWLDRQQKFHNGSSSSYGATVSSNAVIGVALDLDGGSLTFYLNGSTQGSAYTGISGTYLPSICDCANGSTGGSSGIGAGSMNFGQRPFAYTAPSGFKALCTTNLPEPVVAKPSEAMDVKLYTGNGGTQTISGLGFSPDLVWVKSRSNAISHFLYDTVRGFLNGNAYELRSNSTNAEGVPGGSNTGLTAFNSDGFSLGSDAGANTSSATYVAWTWDAGSSTVTNTQGSITSQVRANPSAGFSIVTYTAGATGSTVGHGLGVAPGLIIAKSRTVGANWVAYHSSLGKDGYLHLDLTNAFAANGNYWGSVGPNSTTFGLSNNGFSNNTGNMVAYCFAPVAGYSSFGSYTGNGSADGPFVYTGHRSRWILIKRTDTAAKWTLHDTARDTYNEALKELLPNAADAETNDNNLDILSNGFKLRTNAFASNVSGATYIYAAFAENPFQYARAR